MQLERKENLSIYQEEFISMAENFKEISLLDINNYLLKRKILNKSRLLQLSEILLKESKLEILKKAIEILSFDCFCLYLVQAIGIYNNEGMIKKNSLEKKTAGGIFMSLIKANTSVKQKKEIFESDKILRREKRKMNRLTLDIAINLNNIKI